MLKRKITSFILILTLLVGCGTETNDPQQSTNQTIRDNPEAINLTDGEEETTKEKIDQSTSVNINDEWIVHFIDVGQADATLFQTDDYTILFDTGNWNRRDVVDYLLANQIEEIDLLIGSHPDSDHIGQMSLILEQFKVEEVWMSGVESNSHTFEQILDKIIEHDVNYYEPRAGDRFQLGDLLIEVLSPRELTNDPNDDSISIHLQFGDTAVIMTGDASVKAEEMMIEMNDDIASDILHVGHHGSNTSTGEKFLAEVKPKYAIISAGKDNSYGHPDHEVVDRILSRGITLFTTYQDGTIIFRSNGQEFQLDSSIEQGMNLDHNAQPNEVSHSEDNQFEQMEAESKGCIDINEATVAELTELVHIGEARAQDIIDLRPFKSVEDLNKVSGIGEARLADILKQEKACVR